MTRRRSPPSIRPHLAVLFLLLGCLIPMLFPPAPPPGPAEVSTSRRAFVESASSLLGRVSYFWGGKSDALGWDSRWGVPAVVTAPGSDSTGQSRPFGLDCSGFVSWCAVNAAGDKRAFSAIGNGVREQWSLCTPVAWEEALPGDLAFFPDLSHVGVVAGPPEDGCLPVLHCSASLGGVVCSKDAKRAGFTMIGRPSFYDPHKNVP